MRPSLSLALLTALTMLAFAANSVLNRMALAGGEIGAGGFAAIRLAAGAAMLWALLALRRRGWPAFRVRRHVGAAVALALYMLGFSFAYLALDAGQGALLLFGGVQVTMFAGALALGEQVPARRWAGASLAFGGLVWLLWPAGAEAPALAPAAAMLAAALGWGLYSLIGRGARDPLGDTALAFALALPAGLAALALDAADAPEVSPRGVALAVASGALASGLGYALWYTILPRLGAARGAIAQLTVPVLAMTGGALLLGEVPGLRLLLAAAMVGIGVAVSLPGGARRRAA